MGYNTDYNGILEFINPLTPEQELFLIPMMTCDYEFSPEIVQVVTNGDYMPYNDFIISPDKTGIVWQRDREKSYDQHKAINAIILTMQTKFPDFGLSGNIIAISEYQEAWVISIENGLAVEKNINKLLNVKIPKKVTR
jgi:hypothetical protein